MYPRLEGTGGTDKNGQFFQNGVGVILQSHETFIHHMNGNVKVLAIWNRLHLPNGVYL